MTILNPSSFGLFAPTILFGGLEATQTAIFSDPTTAGAKLYKEPITSELSAALLSLHEAAKETGATTSIQFRKEIDQFHAALEKGSVEGAMEYRLYAGVALQAVSATDWAKMIAHVQRRWGNQAPASTGFESLQRTQRMLSSINETSETIPPQKSAEEKMALAEKFLGEMESLTRRYQQQITALDNGGLAEARHLLAKYQQEADALLQQRPTFPEGSLEAGWVSSVFTSGKMLLVAFGAATTHHLNSVEQKEKTLIQALNDLASYRMNMPHPVLGSYGFRTSVARSELANAVMVWVEAQFLERFWREGKLVLKSRVDGPISASGIGPKSKQTVTWPLKTDPVLNRYLTALGWRLDAGIEKGTYILDFGRHTLAVPANTSSSRRVDGGFELASLTPEEVASLSTGEQVRLAEQLMGKLPLFVERFRLRSDNIPAGDEEARRRFDRAYSMEFTRLIDLFPRSEDPQLLALWNQFQSFLRKWDGKRL
ncbi:MAG: hypothetical protein Q7T03_11090 [Deltaproteobacteria bacterium]|nr:hypothetical protein [Deltaproteobacteria bacterium]